MIFLDDPVTVKVTFPDEQPKYKQETKYNYLSKIYLSEGDFVIVQFYKQLRVGRVHKVLPRLLKGRQSHILQRLEGNPEHAIPPI